MKNHVPLALLAISTATSHALAAGPARFQPLLPRQAASKDTCGAPGLTRCDNPKVPANFCCPAKTKCISLNGDTSILCCPDGDDCSLIEPIICDISQQDATAHPLNMLHSTNLTGSLDKCGNGCCPRGYSCQNGQCSKKAEQKPSATSKPPSPSSSSSTTTSSSSTSTSTDTSTAAPILLPTTSNCPRFPSRAVVAGFFPGLGLGILLALAGASLYRRKKKISAPIYTSSTPTARSDFLRRSTRSRHALSRALSRKSSNTASMEFVLAEDPPLPPPSSFYPSPGGTTVRGGMGVGAWVVGNKGASGGGGGGGGADAWIPPPVPPIPQSQEARVSQMTAFTDLMETAGFKKGEPFVMTPESGKGRRR